MWIDRKFFESLVQRTELQEAEILNLRQFNAQAIGFREALTAQKVKDDVTIDWMRHRINELTKHNAVMLAKAAGVIVPVPEIVPTRPGSMTIPDFSSMPSFEDVGDDEARRLGIEHNDDGEIRFQK